MKDIFFRECPVNVHFLNDALVLPDAQHDNVVEEQIIDNTLTLAKIFDTTTQAQARDIIPISCKGVSAYQISIL